MQPVQIDIFYPLPEGWGICNSCEILIAGAELGQAPYERGLEEYPPEWQAEFQKLSALIYDLSDRYQDRILIRIWDPRSLQGMLKSIRHGVRRYPTFLVGGQVKVVGWDAGQLEEEIKAFCKNEI